VLNSLPATSRPAILRAALAVNSIAPEVLDELVAGLTEQLRRLVKGGKQRKVDGKGAAIAMLRRLAGDAQREALEEIEKADAPLADELRGKLLSFEDIAALSRRDIQTFLSSVETKTLAMALKGAPQEVVDALLSNLSQRAGAAFREEMEMLGRVRLSQVDAAQAELIKTVLKLADEGRIQLTGTEKML
jgi:flagellar motor switch protein FliG